MIYFENYTQHILLIRLVNLLILVTIVTGSMTQCFNWKHTYWQVLAILHWTCHTCEGDGWSWQRRSAH